jgi:hypothetical protein
LRQEFEAKGLRLGFEATQRSNSNNFKRQLKEAKQSTKAKPNFNDKNK